jgi:hypothetical protein
MWNRKHPIAPGFDWRLKAALDRITPPAVIPRYAMAKRFKPWRLAPVALAVSATVLLALSATAATGSANPAVWSQRAASTIESVGHSTEATPSPAPSPQGSSKAPAAPPTHVSAPKPSPKPAPTERPEQSPQPAESEDHSGSSSPAASPKPPPTPDDH